MSEAPRQSAGGVFIESPGGVRSRAAPFVPGCWTLLPAWEDETFTTKRQNSSDSTDIDRAYVFRWFWEEHPNPDFWRIIFEYASVRFYWNPTTASQNGHDNAMFFRGGVASQTVRWRDTGGTNHDTVRNSAPAVLTTSGQDKFALCGGGTFPNASDVAYYDSFAPDPLVGWGEDILGEPGGGVDATFPETQNVAILKSAIAPEVPDQFMYLHEIDNEATEFAIDTSAVPDGSFTTNF